MTELPIYEEYWNYFQHLHHFGFVYMGMNSDGLSYDYKGTPFSITYETSWIQRNLLDINYDYKF